jgi:hypothetical protein
MIKNKIILSLLLVVLLLGATYFYNSKRLFSVEHNSRGNLKLKVDLVNLESKQQPASLGALHDVQSMSEEIIIDKTNDIRTLGYSGQRKIVGDLSGNFYIAYRKKYGSYFHIFVSELKQYSSEEFILRKLLQPLSIEVGRVTQRVPSITVDYQNRVHVVWYGSDNFFSPSERQVWYSMSSDGSNIWTPQKELSSVSGYTRNEIQWQEHPSITIGNANEIFVAWEGKDEVFNKQQIKFVRSLDGGVSWSAWKNVGITDNNVQSRPTMLFDEQKRLHLFMYSSSKTDSGKPAIQYAYSDDYGDRWSEWLILSDESFDARHVSIAMSNNIIHLVFRSQTAEGATDIKYMYLTPEGWGTPVTVLAPNAGVWQFFPSVGVTDSNDVCVTWTETESESEYPNESLESGLGFLACKPNFEEKFSLVSKIGVDNQTVFSQLPEKFESLEKIPILYYDIISTEIRVVFKKNIEN